MINDHKFSEHTTIMTQDTAKQQHDLYMLTFQRTKRFPKPGELVLVHEQQLYDWIQMLESRRDETDRYYDSIKAMVVNVSSEASTDQYSTQQYFYRTELERLKKISKSMIALEVSYLTKYQKGHPMMVACKTPMLKFPQDIEIEDRYFFIDANDAIVVDPILCHTNYLISDQQPDNNVTFGFKDIELSTSAETYYRLYHRADTKPIPAARQLIINMGLKEFSFMSQYNPNKNQQSIDVLKHEIEERSTIESNSMASDDSYEGKLPNDIRQMIESNNFEYLQELLRHPMYQFTKALYATVLAFFENAKINLPEDQVDELYFEIFDLLLRTGVRDDPRINMSADDIKLANSIED